MSRRQFHFVRCFGIALMLMAWGVASNRCALASITLTTAAEKAIEIHQCCPVKSSGDGQQVPEKRRGDCCQGLRILPSEVAEKPFKTAVLSVSEILAWVCVPVRAVEAAEMVMVLATGPPGIRSFAEVVLQRSLLSHAPPFVA